MADNDRRTEAVAHDDLAARTNPRVFRGLIRASRTGGIVLVLLGIIVIVGWFAGLTVLTRLSTGLANMKLNSAVGLVLVGLSIIALGCEERPTVRLVGRLAVAGYGLLGLATLIEYTTGRSLGF